MDLSKETKVVLDAYASGAITEDEATEKLSVLFAQYLNYLLSMEYSQWTMGGFSDGGNI